MENIILNKTNEYIKNATSETLAANIVVFRTIGINEELAIGCMCELLERKNAGSLFDFEGYINKEVAITDKIRQDNKIDILSILKMVPK